MPEPLFVIRLDAEDRALLEACAAKEKLTMSDTTRRAIRAYAVHLGVEATTPKRGKRKPKK